MNVTKEVVLTAGAINTPKLLLLSGIGDFKELDTFPQIRQVAHVPGVGMHFQDHAQVSIRERRRRGGAKSRPE